MAKRTKKQRKADKKALRDFEKKTGIKHKYKYKLYQRGADGELTQPKLTKAEHRIRFMQAVEYRAMLDSLVIPPIEDIVDMDQAREEIVAAASKAALDDIHAQCEAEMFADVGAAP